jgi:HEAT repeat protein
MRDETTRDVFLSYSSDDRRFAERLARDLVDHRLRVWWDRWEMKVGDSLVSKIQEGIQSSSWLAVVLSPNSVESNWVKRELASAIIDEISSDQVRVLPLLLADCSIPPFLRDKIYADFRASYEAGLASLFQRLSPPLQPQIKSSIMSDEEGKVLAAWAKLAPDERQSYSDMLLEKLVSEDSRDRLAALTALAALRHPNLQASLFNLRSDPSPAVRQRVAYQLGRLKRRDVIPAVEVLMQDTSPAVRSAARTAYGAITGAKP